MIAAFLETPERELIQRSGAAFLHGYGTRVELMSATLDPTVLEDGPCWALTFTMPFALEAGGYELIISAASEGSLPFHVLLPHPARVTNVQQGAAAMVSESMLQCAAKQSVSGGRHHSRVLVGCEGEHVARGFGYRSVIANWNGDELHTLQWTAPDGAAVTCQVRGICLDVQRGEPGQWELQVPRDVTPLLPDSPRFVAGRATPSEQGIFGLFADA